MSKIKIHKATTLTAKVGESLSNTQLMEVAPAAFAKKKGVTVLDTYQYIDTEAVLNTLLDMDYVPTSVSQQRSKYPFIDEASKHLIRFRHKKHLVATNPKVGDAVPELVFVNAHDGSSKAHFIVGMFRFICTNGLMVGHTIGTMGFRHHGMTVQQEVNGAVFTMAEETLPLVEEQMAAMRQHQLTEKEQAVFAARALALRWPNGTEAVTTEALLHSRRNDDTGNDVWHTFNRVQENLLQGGFVSATRNARVRALENVTSVVQVNRSLWDEAARLVE